MAVAHQVVDKSGILIYFLRSLAIGDARSLYDCCIITHIIYDAYKSDDPGMHAQEIISALSRYFEQSVTPPFNGEKIAA